jgi:uncharacterized membrane-anchored protein
MTDDKFGSLGLPFKRHASKAVPVNRMKTNLFKVLAFLGALLPMLSTNLFGEQTDRVEQIKQILDGLTWTTGSVVLGNGVANLNLTPDFRYLDPEDTKKVLVDLWGNPPAQAGTLGMIFPANMSPVAQGNWGILMTYREDGYVKDDDAAKIDYNQLLARMKEQVSAQNEQRVKDHFQPIQLIGWAVPPRYDQSSHKLFWAERAFVFRRSESHA